MWWGGQMHQRMELLWQALFIIQGRGKLHLCAVASSVQQRESQESCTASSVQQRESSIASGDSHVIRDGWFE